jgi:hypothetical protein
MQGLRTIAAYLTLVSGAATLAHAQTPDRPVPDPLPSRSYPVGVFEPAPDLSDRSAAQRAAELDRWVEDFTEWMTWSTEWVNRREPGLFTSYRDRRQKPAPPAWLPHRCETVIDASDPLMRACELLAGWSDGNMAAHLRLARGAATATKEDTSKMVWWEHVHIDALWAPFQWQERVYGVIGVHTATTVKGRFQVFLAPGAMLLNVPARNGSRVWKLAANYGFGYRLFDFTLPGDRAAVLHLNFAKAWLLSDVKDAVTGRSTDFAGFSMTLKKVR